MDRVLCINKNLKAMKQLKKQNLTLLMLIISVFSFGQQTISFPKEVNSIKMTTPGIAIVATDDALYGIDKDGKELWKNEKLRKIDAAKIQVLAGSELVLVEGGFRGGGTKIINVFNGNIHAGGDISEARIIHGTNQIWIQTRLHGIHVWDITTNTEQYVFNKINLPYGISSKYNFAGSQPVTYTSEKTAILHIGLGQLGEYNLLTGVPIWEFNWKSYKIKKPKDGKGDRSSDPGKGWAIMKLDEETNTLYFPFRNMLIAIDSKTGKPRWDIKANKVSKIYNIYILDEGIIIHTDKGIDLIDKTTGKLKWKKPIKVKGSGGLLINDGNIFYMVAKKSIERIDIANKKSTALTEKIKFQGGESFQGFELLDNIIVLTGSQNVVGVDKNTGKILFSTYHKAPGPSVGDIAKAAALAGVAMTASMNSYNLNKQAGNSTYIQYTPNMRSISSKSASTNADKSLFIKTKFKDVDAKGFGIAKVAKLTGETTNKVVIGVRNPVYVVDEVSGVIYYKSDKKIVTIKLVK